MRRNSFVQMALTGRIGVRLSGGGSSLDADAATLIAAMTTAPDSTRQGHINTLITGLKTDGVWDELDELWVMAAHAEQAGLLGWKRAKDLTAVNAPAFEVDRGFTGNGSTSYLNTNFVPSTDGVQYTQNDASLGAYSRTNVGDAAIVDIGASDGTRLALLKGNQSGNMRALLNSASPSLAMAANTDSSGFLAVRRANATHIRGWRNGVALGSDVASSSNGLVQRSLTICAIDNNGTLSEWSSRQYAAAFVGAAMSEAQQLALFTRLETYLDAIGAGVVA